jgi:hypothetical protein
MLSRARSKVCVRSRVVGAGAAGAGAGVDGTSVRCGGVGAVGAGSGGVAAGAGCAGGVRGGAGRAGGAVTVMEGTGVAPGGEGGVSAAGCCAGCELGGVSPGVAGGAEGAGPAPDPGVPWGAGAGVGVGAAGGAASGGCGCEGATVSMQLSQNSDELLRRSKRLLRLDIPDPRSFSCENVPSHRLCSAVGASDAPTRMRSSDGRRAGRKGWRGRGDPAKFHRRIRAPPPESKRQRDGRRFGQSNSAGQVYECTDRTIMICAIRAVMVCGSGSSAICRLDCRRGLRTNPVEVHMSERDDELERERKQRDVRAQPQTRSKPVHGP